ncbi:MAG: hypothetical protein AVDCRST_MAG59-3733, partial [uncultured Thermomicrobiales bacterium]
GPRRTPRRGADPPDHWAAPTRPACQHWPPLGGLPLRPAGAAGDARRHRLPAGLDGLPVVPRDHDAQRAGLHRARQLSGDPHRPPGPV